MLEILISSTVLILALTALRFFLRGKLNPRLQYTLWLLAALRLLLPVSLVRSPVSVMNAVPDVPAAVQRLTAPEDRRAPQTDNTQSPVQTASETETAPTEAQMQLTGSTILKLVWLTGAAAMALAVLAQNLLFLRRLKRIRRPFACPESPVPVWVASGLPSPCLAGLFRPEIYLTPEAAQDPETRQFVLRHELAHYHARDQLWSLLRLICQCLYWFDPFVWLAAALSQRDCELACFDEMFPPERAAVHRMMARYGRETMWNLLQTKLADNAAKALLPFSMAAIEPMPRYTLYFLPWYSSNVPGLSSHPAKILPIIHTFAPAAIAFVISPEYLIPPSAIIGIPYSFAAS